MNEHPIQGLMSTTMQNIKEMVDVNTIVGEAVEAADGTVIIPISKVSFGFAAGGSEFKGDIKEDDEDQPGRMPFGGGSGAGVGITPVGFLVVNKETIRILPVNFNTSLDKVLEFIPDVVEKLNESFKKMVSNHREGRRSEESSKEGREGRESREPRESKETRRNNLAQE